MVIARLVVLPANSTGYSLRTLLGTAGVLFTEGRPVRFAQVKIAQVGNTANSGFVVETAGAYTPSSGVIPPNHGWNFVEQEPLAFELKSDFNCFGVDEIILAGAINIQFSVFLLSV